MISICGELLGDEVAELGLKLDSNHTMVPITIKINPFT